MIESRIFRLHLKHAWTISRNTSQYKDNVFISIENDGITGIGEAAPNIRYGESADLTIKRINEVKDIFKTFDWSDYKSIKKALDKRIKNQSCAKAALDMALLDWNSKKANLPLYKFLGIPDAKTQSTSFSIGIDSPKMLRKKIEEAESFPIYKIKLGTKNDETIMTTIRSMTNKPIRVDANEGWKTKETALDKIHWLEEMDVEFIEQPLPVYMIEETAWLKEKSNLPIIADEAVKTASDIPAIAQAFDGINIKLMKSGGIQEALKMIQTAQSFGLKIMLGCMIESSLAISAAAQLASLANWLDLDGNLLIDNDPYSGIIVKNGELIIKNIPGLGVSSKQ